MDKKEFIKKMSELYEDFNEKNIKARTEAYLIVLNDEIDYDKLWKDLIMSYESFKYAPTPAHLLKLIKIKWDY